MNVEIKYTDQKINLVERGDMVITKGGFAYIITELNICKK